MNDRRVGILVSFLDDLDELDSMFDDINIDIADIGDYNAKDEIKRCISKLSKLNAEITEWLYREKVSKNIDSISIQEVK